MQDQDTASPNDIAIIGMALRVPGARTPDEFWQNLRSGTESIRNLSEDELIAAGESRARMLDPKYVARTSDMPDMEMFDADFFGLSPKEAAIMDPQHRQFLECTWEAMEDAGRTPNTMPGPVGVFAGCGMGSYFYFNVCSNRQLLEQTGMFLLRHTGNDKDFLSTRASFSFDLRGPSVNVQTACSTSLVAVHYACQSLLSGECDMALAGGVTIELPHRRGYIYHDGEILSPDGRCRPFDHRAAGTVFGSGAGVVVLRRLSDALADGDIIHAVIKASAINNDGASKAGYLAPSVTGQAEAIIEAQGLAGISAETIQYVECHGTGTALGDPIEIEALTQAFRQTTNQKGFCHVGSVKSNIGHLDTAAGVVSLIKTTLALKNAEIPPTLGFEKPNPSIDFASSPFVVASQLTSWPDTDGPRRAAVNSLGVGGTNAHIVLEQAPDVTPVDDISNDEPAILLFSAKHRKALDGATKRLGTAFATNSGLRTVDAAFTLHQGRVQFEHRRVAVVRDRADAVAVLSGDNPKRMFTHSAIENPVGAVFLLPGGGAQHVGMARRLFEEDARFRSFVEEGFSYLEPAIADEIRAVWFATGGDKTAEGRTFLRPSLQLPAILIVEVAIARLWKDWGVSPKALIGHSMGEYAAACISGVMSYRDAVNLVRLRGELFDIVEPGGMLSVPVSVETLKSLLPASLDIASVNAPELCVVSGRDEDLALFQAELAEKGIDASRVAIDIAAHSRMLDGILPRFEAFVRSIRLNPPTIPIMSNLAGHWLTNADACDPTYWVRHLRSTVLFNDGMARLSVQPGQVYIEIGPGRTLSSLAKMQTNIDANQVINTLPHADDDADDRLHFLSAIGRAWATGIEVDISRSWKGRDPRRVQLPTYAFQHQRYFIERVVDSSAPIASDDAPLLRQEDMSDWGYRPVWKQVPCGVAIDASMEPRSWLIFIDDTGLGERLVDRLRSSGHYVVTVTAGDGFSRIDASSYSLCPEEGRGGYDALFTSLSEDGEVPVNIVHMWLVTGDENHRRASSFFDRIQEQGFYSLLHLAQAMGDAGVAGSHLTVLTNGMQRVGDETLAYPGKATVLGPGLVIPKELERTTVRMVDIELLAKPKHNDRPGLQKLLKLVGDVPSSQTADVLDQLWEDLCVSPASETVAYRKGRRWVASHERLPLKPSDPTQQFRHKGTYLLTGGLGDLSLVVARELATQFSARLVLLGRTELPERSQWTSYRRMHSGTDKVSRAIAAIEELEVLGAEVIYRVADVRNVEQMTAAVEAAKNRFGSLNGVLHTAGIVRDNLIQLKSFDEIEDVLSPKVYGTSVLARVLEKEDIDFLVLFSSTSTDTAPVGQVDYVAANAYLNAYAESRSGDQKRQTVAVHWGVWNEVGIAARASLHPGSASTPSKELIAAKGPVFERWVEDADQTQWLEFTASPATHWMWNEHRLVSGQAILPGTGYIELLAQAANEYGFAGGFEIEDLIFISPLSIEDETTKSIRVRFEQDGNDYRAFICAADQNGVSDSIRLHAEASVRLAPPSVLPPVQLSLGDSHWTTRRRAADGAALRSAQEDNIRFGSRWSVLRALSIGKGEALAQLSLSDDYAGDIETGLRFHPALLDIATGYAMELIEGYASSGVLWAPMSYGSIRIYENLPQQVLSHVRLSKGGNSGPDYSAFDVTITALDGSVILEIERFTIKRLANDLSLSVTSAGAVSHGEVGAPPSAAALELAAQVRQGIMPSEGFTLLSRVLATRRPQAIVSSLPLDKLRERAARRVDTQASPSAQLFERPDLENDYIAPRNDVERTLAGYWSELLGVEKIGVSDNFFDVGGHSLIAVRLFRMIHKTYGIDLPISVLFQAPTIAECADLIGKNAAPAESADTAEAPEEADTQRIHLVSMTTTSAKATATPLFLCAGMFGNVLNLRHIALQIGNDRPVYCLQARGLYANQEPHETFTEMARDYLSEIRTVQPSGPYLLGGFSGGGLVAYEMAQQLEAAGETVEIIIMLDTPLPGYPVLSMTDKVLIKAQDIKRERGAFIRNWIEHKRNWANYQRARSDALQAPAKTVELHNERVHSAFLRALDRYEVKPYDGQVLLLRPKLEPRYLVTGGRQLNADRDFVRHDNGWSPLAANLDVIEVPGDHDSMVLNPNVRVLSDKIRQHLKLCDQRVVSRSRPIAAE